MPEEDKTTFFQEDNGNRSSMRLMCFVSLITAIICGILVTIGKGTSDGVIITFGFLVAAFAPKAVQKLAEANIENVTKNKKT